MVIYTNSGKIKKYRKLIVELLLAAHCRDCTTCVKSGNVCSGAGSQTWVHNIRFRIQESIMRLMTVHHL